MAGSNSGWTLRGNWKDEGGRMGLVGEERERREALACLREIGFGIDGGELYARKAASDRGKLCRSLFISSIVSSRSDPSASTAYLRS